MRQKKLPEVVIVGLVAGLIAVILSYLVENRFLFAVLIFFEILLLPKLFTFFFRKYNT